MPFGRARIRVALLRAPPRLSRPHLATAWTDSSDAAGLVRVTAPIPARADWVTAVPDRMNAREQSSRAFVERVELDVLIAEKLPANHPALVTSAACGPF
jgi:hypothetical protein